MVNKKERKSWLSVNKKESTSENLWLSDKKGWLRILEAFIAVILIAIVLIVIISRQNGEGNADEIYKLQKTILNEVAKNNELRQAVLDGNITPVNESISERIPKIFDLEVKICEVDEVCAPSIYREEVYAEEIVIMGTLGEYSPKKLKLFMWQKS